MLLNAKSYFTFLRCLTVHKSYYLQMISVNDLSKKVLPECPPVVRLCLSGLEASVLLLPILGVSGQGCIPIELADGITGVHPLESNSMFVELFRLIL